MYLRNEAVMVLNWLFTMGLVGVTWLLLVQTKIIWKRLQQDASWQHKAAFIVMLILTVPFAVGTTGVLALMVLLTLGVIE